jgi:hypothetical protein
MALLIEGFQRYNTTIDEARRMLRDDLAGHAKWAFAMAVIGTAFEISTEIGLEDKPSPTAFEDMLLGLKRGNLAASSAICLLHGATQRPWPKEVFGSSRDPKEWEEYLRSNGFLTD